MKAFSCGLAICLDVMYTEAIEEPPKFQHEIVSTLEVQFDVVQTTPHIVTQLHAYRARPCVTRRRRLVVLAVVVIMVRILIGV